MSPMDASASDVAAVVTLYLQMPHTPIRVSVSEQWLARHCYQDGVSLEIIETALLLGSLRRLIRPTDAPRLSPIRSLAYFRPVIEELQQNPMPENYREYLRLKTRRAAQSLPGRRLKNYVF